jgi:hypothetical protein
MTLYATSIIISNPLIIYTALASVVIAGLLMISKLRFTADVPWFIRIGALVIMVLAFIFSGVWTIFIPLIYIAYALISNSLARKAERAAIS